IGFALAQQALGVFAVESQSIRLAVGSVGATNIGTFIPIEAEPMQIPNELIFETNFTALHVGVFDAQDHGAMVVAGKEPVEKGGASVANMQMSGGRRCEAHTDGGFCVHKIMLTGEPEA